MLSSIQNWVLTAPSLTLDRLLMRVNPNCPTGIASLDVAECVSGDTITECVSGVLLLCIAENL